MRHKHTTGFIWFCLAALAGLALSRTTYDIGYWPFVLLAIIFFVFRVTILRYLAIILLGLALGWMRGDRRAEQLTAYDLLYNHSVTVEVSVNEDAVYGKAGQLAFVGVQVINLQTGQSLPGQIGISGFGPLAIYEADRLVVTGKLRPGVGSYQGFISFGELSLVQHNPSLISGFRRQFGASLLSVLPEPTASFAMGILIGQRATLPEQVKDDLQKVGLTHIVAVSGANLTIMLEASRKVLGKRSKRLSTWLSLGLMLVFVAMTGGSASIVRAAFVSGLSVWAAYYGRRSRPLLLISLVAAVTALINPIYIWSDASWYLSFLAFFGVLMVSPLLQQRLPQAFQTNIILAIALESICAEIMSLPYILWTFGQMSFVGLLANVLVVSFIPYAMLGSFVAGLAGLFMWPLAGWFAWPANIIMTYMLDTAHLLANHRGVFKDGIWLTTPGVIAMYVLIGVMIWLLNFKETTKSATITDKNQFEPTKILGRVG